MPVSARTSANLPDAMPYLSRAFFFDNSGAEMKYLYSANFALTVRNGRLALSNSKPSGTYILVR